MDWEFIVTICVAVAFGAVSIVLALRLAKKKKPVWASNTMHIVGRGTDAPEELKLYFGNKQVEDVYRSRVAFFNRGNETIRKEDITEAIIIHFPDAEILTFPNVLHRSKQAIGFSVENSFVDESAVCVDFTYLDYHDGGVFEVLHTGTSDIACKGNIIGSNRIIDPTFPISTRNEAS